MNDGFPYLQLTIPIFCAERNTLTYQNTFELFCSFVKVSFWQFTVTGSLQPKHEVNELYDLEIKRC